MPNILYQGKRVVTGGGGGVSLPVNGLPSPFTGDTSCLFWFDGGPKNFAGTSARIIKTSGEPLAVYYSPHPSLPYVGVYWKNDSSYQYLDISNVTSAFTLSSDFTLVSWTSLDNTANTDQQFICMDGPGFSKGWALVLRNDTQSGICKWQLYARDGGGGSVSGASSHLNNDSVLRFYALTYTASSRAFVFARNGTTEVSFTVPSGGTGISPSNLKLGYWNNDSYRRLSGYTRSFCAWSRVLSGSELSALYNSGSGLHII